MKKFKQSFFLIITFSVLSGNLFCQPANNACANAIPLTFTAGTSTVAATTVAATYDFDYGCNIYANPRNVWYKFTAVGHDYTIILKPGTLRWASWALYDNPTNCSSSGGYFLDCAVAGTNTGNASNTGNCLLQQGRTYYLWVGDDAGTTGTFTLTITNSNSAIIPNDDLYNAGTIDACGADFNGTTIGATSCGDLGTPGINSDLDNNINTDPFFYGDGSDVDFSVENSSWYRFCVLATTTYTVSFKNIGSCTGANGLQYAIFRGSPTALTLLAGGTSGMNIAAGVTRTVSLTFNAGTCVYILVDGFAGTNCNYSIKLTPATVCSILPIELVSFSATAHEEFISLDWTTAYEKNNEYFVIEKSNNGSYFSEVTKLKGAAISNGYIDYSANDTSPIPGVSYYRLKQIDFDGNIQYSKIVSVEYKKKEELEFNIVPNPSEEKSNVNIQFSFVPDKEVTIIVSSINGSILYEKVEKLDNNILQIPFEFQKGFYFVKLVSEDISETKRLIIK